MARVRSIDQALLDRLPLPLAQLYEAATYANCVASFVVEVVGANGIPSDEVISIRLRTASAALARAR